MKRVSAIIAAAGEGKRFGSYKPFALLRGRPVLDWCLDKFEQHEQVHEIILVLKDEAQKDKYLGEYKKITAVTRGGERRQDSVLSGFRLLDPKRTEIVLVHDGVRPLVSKDLICRVIACAQAKGATAPAIPIDDTIKVVEGKEVSQTIDRSKLLRIQTPQGFLYPILKQALDKASEDNFFGTDEAALVERTGQKVFTIQGDSKNIKVTTQDDIKIAEVFLED